MPHTLARVGSMLTLFFNARAGDRLAHRPAAATRARFARFFWGMIERGVYLPCSQFEALFVSAAHTEADIDATVSPRPTCWPGLAQRILGN